MSSNTVASAADRRRQRLVIDGTHGHCLAKGYPATVDTDSAPTGGGREVLDLID